MGKLFLELELKETRIQQNSSKTFLKYSKWNKESKWKIGFRRNSETHKEKAEYVQLQHDVLTTVLSIFTDEGTPAKHLHCPVQMCHHFQGTMYLYPSISPLSTLSPSIYSAIPALHHLTLVWVKFHLPFRWNIISTCHFLATSKLIQILL